MTLFSILLIAEKSRLLALMKDRHIERAVAELTSRPTPREESTDSPSAPSSAPPSHTNGDPHTSSDARTAPSSGSHTGSKRTLDTAHEDDVAHLPQNKKQKLADAIDLCDSSDGESANTHEIPSTSRRRLTRSERRRRFGDSSRDASAKFGGSSKNSTEADSVSENGTSASHHATAATNRSNAPSSSSGSRRKRNAAAMSASDANTSDPHKPRNLHKPKARRLSQASTPHHSSSLAIDPRSHTSPSSSLSRRSSETTNNIEETRYFVSRRLRYKLMSARCKKGKKIALRRILLVRRKKATKTKKKKPKKALSNFCVEAGVDEDDVAALLAGEEMEAFLVLSCDEQRERIRRCVSVEYGRGHNGGFSD